MALPFYLTLVRVVMSPIFLVLYLHGQAWGISQTTLPFVLLFIVVLCEITDFFDGFLARRYGNVTELGKILDPMADSIFRLSVFLSFTQGVVQIPLMVVLLIFLRESIITSLRTVCALQGVALAARISGKVKAVIQATTVFFILGLMIPYSTGHLAPHLLQNLSFYAATIAAFYTVVSGIEYLTANWKFIRKAFG